MFLFPLLINAVGDGVHTDLAVTLSSARSKIYKYADFGGMLCYYWTKSTRNQRTLQITIFICFLWNLRSRVGGGLDLLNRLEHRTFLLASLCDALLELHRVCLMTRTATFHAG